jgi:hypothetical protein
MLLGVYRLVSVTMACGLTIPVELGFDTTAIVIDHREGCERCRQAYVERRSPALNFGPIAPIALTGRLQ